MNRETKLGLYIVGGIVIALGFLAYGAVTFITQGVPYLNRMTAQSRSATADANLFVDGPFNDDYAASAVLELPPVSPQPDSPSVQLGFFLPTASVQGGLMRTPSDKFRLRAFIAYSSDGKANKLRYLGRLNEGPHRVELRVHDGKVLLSIDGRRLFTVIPRSAFLPRDGNPWLALGTAVRRGGSASGTIADIDVQRDGDTALKPFQPVCIVSNGGIHIVADGAHWVLGGTYARSVPATYEHCRDVFAQHNTRKM